jgi:hypothetical protein
MAETTTPQVVINHHLWTTQLGARPDVIGSTIQLNSTAFTVIGVTATASSVSPSCTPTCGSRPHKRRWW